MSTRSKTIEPNFNQVHALAACLQHLSQTKAGEKNCTFYYFILKNISPVEMLLCNIYISEQKYVRICRHFSKYAVLKYSNIEPNLSIFVWIVINDRHALTD